MRYLLKGICGLVILVGITTSVGGALNVPDQMDWSPPQILLGTNPTAKLPPVIRDEESNFHIIWNEHGSLIYKIVGPDGTLLLEQETEIPGLTGDTLYHGIPVEGGVMLVWADRAENGDYTLLRSEIKAGKGFVETTKLDYVLPDDPRLASLFRVLGAIHGDIDSQGNLHLVINGGVPSTSRIVYFRFDSQGEQVFAEFAHPNRSGIGVQFPGMLVLDRDDTAYVLGTISGSVTLSTFYQRGDSRRRNLGRTVLDIQGRYSTPYASRRVPPMLAVDDTGIVHIVWNHLTLAGLGDLIIDVKYLRVRDNELLEEKIITGQQGISHFPTISAFGDKVYITWEEGQRGSQELFYAVFATDGTQLIEKARLTWEQNTSRLGLLYGNPDGHLTAFWWRSGSPGARLAIKSTYFPVEDSFWHRAGIITYDPENPPISQVFYYGSLIMLMSLAQVLLNVHNLLWLLLGLFGLYKLGLLERLLEAPWRLLGLCLIALYFTIPPLKADALFVLDQGFYNYAALIAAGFLVLIIKVTDYKIDSTINIAFACVLWLWLLMIIQLTPVIPHQFIM